MTKNTKSSPGVTGDRRRRSRSVLIVAGVLALVGFVGGGIAEPHLTSSLSDYEVPGSPVALAQSQIERWTGANPDQIYEVVVHTTAPMKLTSPLPARVKTVIAVLKARPEVKGILDYADTFDRAMISKSGTYTAVLATVGVVHEAQAVAALQRALAAQPSLKGNAWLGGPTVGDVQISSVSSQDLGRAELIALPFLLVLLFFVFRGRRAATIPIVGAVFAIAVTMGAMGLITLATPLSVFALNLVIALGLGLAIDFSLLMVSRFREEFGRQGAVEPALATLRRTAGRTVFFSSITIAAAMATLCIFPERFIYSMGIAGAIVVLAAGAFALLVLPSILVLFGERICVPSRRLRPATDAGRKGHWYRIASFFMRRPAIWALSAILVLVVLAGPFLHFTSTGVDASDLPTSTSAGETYQLIQDQFPDFSEAPANLEVEDAHVTPAQLSAYSAAALAVPGVEALSPFQHLGGSLWQTYVTVAGAPLSPEAQRSIQGLQALHGPGHDTVIGETASYLTLQSNLRSHLPIALLLIVLVALIMLVVMTGSLLLPVMAVAMNFLTIGASFGLLVWAFQWGHLRHLLGFAPPGALESTSLIIILAVVFGLSTDYGVFVLGRIKEEHDAGAEPGEAVALGIERTGGIVSAAACCLALAVGALMLSRLIFVKELGLGVAFAVILDATVVRCVLLPALMKLFGRASWWLPTLRGHPPLALPAQPSVRPQAPADQPVEPTVAVRPDRVPV
jgi:uncharacterized membrane protein YdfJ with MMPL/SSD domain